MLGEALVSGVAHREQACRKEVDHESERDSANDNLWMSRFVT